MSIDSIENGTEIKPLKLKIGSRERKEGYTHIDIDPDANPDIVADCCNMPMIPDNSVDEILIEHVLEHIPNTMAAMKEFYRVLKYNRSLIILVPHGRNYNFWGTPDHVKPFIELTFRQFRRYNTYHVDFIAKKIKTIWEFDRHYPFIHRREIYAELIKKE